MPPRYEIFDHTADLGIRLFAESPEKLFPIAAEALYAVIGELLPTGEGVAVDYEFTGSQHADLLRDFLTKLLVLFETEHAMLCDVTVQDCRDDSLRVAGRLSPVDTARSVYLHEVKAITYHELAVKKTKDGFEATIIVDI